MCLGVFWGSYPQVLGFWNLEKVGAQEGAVYRKWMRWEAIWGLEGFWVVRGGRQALNLVAMCMAILESYQRR